MTSLALAPVLALLLATASLSELFVTAKQEFKAGSYEKALATLAVLDQESARPGREKEREAVLPGLLFYRAASLAGLDRQKEAVADFKAFLELKPGATLDPALYSKPVIGAFEDARKEIASRQRTGGPAESGAIAAAYHVFVPPSRNRNDSGSEDWSGGPVRWLLTAAERRSYSALADPVSRSEFIANFWKVRDRIPETPQNEFREEFERRVAFADTHFAQDETRGSLTDRGMVFLLLGPPTYSGRKALKTGDDIADPSGLSRYTRSEVAAASQTGGSNASRQARIESVTGPNTTILVAETNWIEFWHYRDNLPKSVGEHEVVFEFVTKVGYGHNVLQRDPAALATLARAAGRQP